ncbi:S-layer homology domain-containing protein [Paenibacillus foliorum]|nr:S-layer homology domain-containing protein [Paenibacillus foliorum]
MKKIINYMLLVAILFSFIPVAPVKAADSGNFFILDDGKLASTSALDIENLPDSLNRESAKISNTPTIEVTGTIQKVTGTLTLTVDAISQNKNTKIWGIQPGKTAVTPVSVTNNRFKATNAQLFQGYNKLTFEAANGAKTVFYVLFDTAPIIKSMQVVSNSVKHDLNEPTTPNGTLVLQKNTAVIQGSAENANTITINGLQATKLSNGLFFSPTLILEPGLNEYKITLTNDTDSVTVSRRFYFYDKTPPFIEVKATQFKDLNGSDPTTAETQSLLGGVPTFTGQDDKISLEIEILAPYDQNIDFPSNATIHTGSTLGSNLVTIAAGSATSTVINDTYGTPEFRLLKFKTNPVPMPNGTSTSQQLDLTIDYSVVGGTPFTITGSYKFKLASGLKVINNVLFLPDFIPAVTATPPAPVTVTDATPSYPLSGSNIRSSEFYVLVEASGALDPLNETLRVNLQTVAAPALTVTAVPATDAIVGANTRNKGQLYKISGLPEGTQTLDFSLDNINPVPLTGPVSYSAKVSYAAKLYVEIQNIYENQVIEVNSSDNATNGPDLVPLEGAFIGFGGNILSGGVQMLLNNVDRTPLLTVGATNASGNNPISVVGGLKVDAAGPLYNGENVLKIIVTYRDGGSALRTYVKEIKFYILDTNIPDIRKIRPITPPASASTTRDALSLWDDSIPLPPSPELQFNNAAYTTSLENFDLFVRGSGADVIEIKDAGERIFYMTMATGLPGGTSTKYSSAEVSGDRNGFKLRLNNVAMKIGTHVYTIELTNSNGGKVSQTLTVIRQNFPYRILAPTANTGDKIIVNKNFVLFDVEADGAKEVQINGVAATPRTDTKSDRFMYTYMGLKADTDNKISITVKRDSGDLKETVNVRYVSDPAPGSMYMEAMGSKHSVFNKDLQLSFPKNTILRRVSDGKIQPQTNLLFGIGDTENGNTELVNDYNQIVGKDLDGRTNDGRSRIDINSNLGSQFSEQLGRDHFTRVSDYFWISGGIGEKGKVGDAGYKPATGGLTPYSTTGVETVYYTNYDDERKVVPTERGTLVLKYSDSVVDLAAAEVTVFYLNDEGDWKNIGGAVDAKAKTITVPFDNFGYYMVGKLKNGYNDISNHDWARDILQALLSKGYMPALYTNEFGAAEYIRRGEFAGLIVRALGLKLNYDDNETFRDIDRNSSAVTWTYEEIETAARAGIIQGYDNEIFDYDKEITRQDAAVMISRAMNLKLAMNDDKLKAKVEKAFADGDKVSIYARAAVDALSSAKVMVGSPVISAIPTKNKPLINFNPLDNMTRAEAGQIAVRLLQKYVKGSLPANLGAPNPNEAK